jgi:myo-inositol-1(or 4)-monophosphatase
MDRDRQFSDILAFAESIARKAGALIAQLRDEGLAHQYKSAHELVTNADLAADKLIIEQIQVRFPHHALMTEESYKGAFVDRSLKNPIWIVDPIDGTVNYAHGHHMVAVSIAYAIDGEVHVGVVHNPFLNETYTAALGQGSHVNGIPLSVSHQPDLRKALIATGFPYEKSGVAVIIERVQKILMHCQDIRRLGSAAMDICWVAHGRLDGYFESLSPWDFAAARLIAQEAGARCGHFSPVPDGVPACIHSDDLLICTPELYDPLLQLLTSPR